VLGCCVLRVNNISVISLWSALMVEEIGDSDKNHHPPQVTDTLYVVLSTPCHAFRRLFFLCICPVFLFRSLLRAVVDVIVR
jgi:hypothetical protein